jgi:hypothetical protein
LAEDNYKATMFTSDLEERFYQMKMRYISDIFSPVSHREEQDEYADLRKDILKRGMKNPIILIPNTFENYNLAIRQVNPTYIKPFSISYKYLCMYGNQRLHIYRTVLAASYIPSVLTENVEWSHAVYLELKNNS